MRRILILAILLLIGCASEEPTAPPLVAPDDGCELDFCEHEGWCTNVNGECRATTVAECEQSQVCVKYGRCVPRKGKCAVN